MNNKENNKRVNIIDKQDNIALRVSRVLAKQLTTEQPERYRFTSKSKVDAAVKMQKKEAIQREVGIKRLAAFEQKMKKKREMNKILEEQLDFNKDKTVNQTDN